MDDAVRRQKIQDRIADGRLPNDKIGRVSATYGTGEACDACSLAVSTEQVLYRLGRLGVQELIFHNACFAGGCMASSWWEPRHPCSAC